MKIIAYGSLLNLKSLEKTLGRKTTLIPIEVAGVERIFNAPFGEYSFLNLKFNKFSVIGAAYFELTEREVGKFSEREAGSKLRVVMKGYYAFCWNGRTDKNLPVLQSYIDVCVSGAASLGVEFWKNTKRPTLVINDLARPLYP